MIDDFLTSPDDLPFFRPRRTPGADDPESTADAASDMPPNASRTALAAGVLFAAAIVGTSAPEEDTSTSRSPPSTSRTS